MHAANPPVPPGTEPLSHLGQLPNGHSATVVAIEARGVELGAGPLRRLLELGFLPGERVTAIRRGPGGREPLAVVVGGTMLALRWMEAASIQVQPDSAA